MTSGALWVGSIAAFIGFIYGSVPTHGENRGWRFDFGGAVCWAVFLGGVVGGVVQGCSAGFSLLVIAVIASAALLFAIRLYLDRPPRVPVGVELVDGINQVPAQVAPGDSFAVAEKMYLNASFSNGSYNATRSPRDYRFGKKGIDAQTASTLANSLGDAESGRFEILVILVRELPNEPGTAGVIVVRGAGALKRTYCYEEGISVPGIENLIEAKNIAGVVGYAFR